jgi:hypothetical protein
MSAWETDLSVLPNNTLCQPLARRAAPSKPDHRNALMRQRRPGNQLASKSVTVSFWHKDHILGASIHHTHLLLAPAPRLHSPLNPIYKHHMTTCKRTGSDIGTSQHFRTTTHTNFPFHTSLLVRTEQETTRLMNGKQNEVASESGLVLDTYANPKPPAPSVMAVRRAFRRAS